MSKFELCPVNNAEENFGKNISSEDEKYSSDDDDIEILDEIPATILTSVSSERSNDTGFVSGDDEENSEILDIDQTNYISPPIHESTPKNNSNKLKKPKLLGPLSKRKITSDSNEDFKPKKSKLLGPKSRRKITSIDSDEDVKPKKPKLLGPKSRRKINT